MHFKTLKARTCLTILLQNTRPTLAEDSENQTNNSEHDGGFVVVDIEEETTDWKKAQEADIVAAKTATNVKDKGRSAKK